MGLISWTDTLATGDIHTASHITNMKSDITTAVNGGISNANIASGAAIAESKIAFSTTGHTHNGTDANYPLIKHYRRGMSLKQGTDNEDIVVTAGVVDIAGKLFVSTSASANIDIVSGTWADAGSCSASNPIYVYAYSNAGTLAFAMSTEAPDLSDSSDGVAEYPFRYQKYGTTYYRLIGIVHTDASSDLFPNMYTNFDLSNFATGSFVGTGNDYTVYTGWTPNVVQWIVCADSAPATTDAMDKWGWAQLYGYVTANPEPAALMYSVIDNQHLTSANGTANTIYGMTAQTAATTGSGKFTFDAPANGQVLMWMAWHSGGNI